MIQPVTTIDLDQLAGVSGGAQLEDAVKADAKRDPFPRPPLPPSGEWIPFTSLNASVGG